MQALDVIHAALRIAGQGFDQPAAADRRTVTPHLLTNRPELAIGPMSIEIPGIRTDRVEQVAESAYLVGPTGLTLQRHQAFGVRERPLPKNGVAFAGESRRPPPTLFRCLGECHGRRHDVDPLQKLFHVTMLHLIAFRQDNQP